MTQHIFINGGVFETRLALMAGERLVECRHLPFGAADQFAPAPLPVAGTLCLGRITRMAAELEAAFVDIGFEAPGFLPVSAMPAGARPSEGALLAVRIAKSAFDDKGPKLSARLSPEQSALARPHLSAGSARPGPLPGGLPGLAEAVAGLARAETPERVEVDHALAYARLKAELPSPLAGALARAPEGDLFARHHIGGQIEAALEPIMPLTGGGNLIIEPTSALTAIDVNSGGMGGAKLRQRLNLAAAKAIPPALRLRGIGGQVVIDFLPMRRPEQQQAVMAALKTSCRPDPARIKISRMTSGGLVALTRERARPSLAAELLAPAANPAPSPSPGAGANAMLRALAREARGPGGRNFRLAAAADIAAWLEGRGDFRLAAGREFGINLEFVLDETLEPGIWRLERNP